MKLMRLMQSFGSGVWTGLSEKLQSRMAAVTELCFLLFVLISNIHTEQRITIKEEGESYGFVRPTNETNYCLISRFVGEEKLVLWNTSELWSENTRVPEDLKQRLSVRNQWNLSFYEINNLTYSDSGLYQETCWTKNTETHEENIRIIVCGSKKIGISIPVNLGQTVDLPCEGAADSLTQLWLKSEKQDYTWTRVFGDSTTSVTDNDKGRFQMVQTTSTFRINVTIRDIVKQTYNCLLMNQQLCVSSNPVDLNLRAEFLYYTVEDTAVLHCPISDFSDSLLIWKKDLLKSAFLGLNRSLIISPLTLNDSGWYSCQTFSIKQSYNLFVCPKFGPPVVQLFSEGEDVTLTCDPLEKGLYHIWFIKSEQTNGKIITVYEAKNNLNSRFTAFRSNGSLIISNVSLKDTGDYWCAVSGSELQCVSTVKYMVKRRDPFGISSTFYRVWSSLLSALLMMLCVVVAVVNHRTRRPEQL